MDVTNYILYFMVISPVLYLLKDHINKRVVFLALSMSVIGFAIVVAVVPRLSWRLANKGDLWGYDLGKGIQGKTMKIPESLGIVCGVTYVVCVCFVLFVLFSFWNETNQRDPALINYCAGLFSSMFMLFLGFADDVLDLRWRYKLVLPSLAVLPMLVTYGGVTKIVVPLPLRGRFGLGHHVELGVFYKLYMFLVAVYCSNTINIYAGINGLETSQSLIICVFTIMHNLIEMKGRPQYRKNHEFSLMCMLPFLGTTTGLLFHNWYPSSVFVGDSFTYFSGMTFATVGILGHFSKTLMLFFIPQWLNFFYSLPQLFGLVKLPRHRIPIFNESTGLLESSGNWTLINLMLDIFGPMKEVHLTILLGILQVAWCCFGLFFVRYKLAGVYYPPEEFEEPEGEDVEKEKLW